MNKAQQLKAVSDMWLKLEMALGHLDTWGRYQQQVKTEEKDHRRAFCRDQKYGLSVRDAVMLHAVKRILMCRTGEQKRPAVRMIFSYLLSGYQAWAIWVENKPEIRGAVSMKEAKLWLDSVNYAELTGAVKP